MTFGELKIGQTFDFINPTPQGQLYNSFYLRCKKISPRRYTDLERGWIYHIGSIYCHVYHVDEKEELT